MKEHIIFSKFVGGLGEENSLFIQLSSESDVAISGIAPISLELAETFSSTSPVVVFEFIDGNGDFFNILKPTPDIKYFFMYGTSMLNSSRVELRCTKMVSVNTRAGSSNAIAYKMFFSIYGWNDLVNTSWNRSWPETTRHSDVVKQLVREAGLDVSMVKDTLTTGLVIQPHWNNVKLLRNIVRSCETANPGKIEYGCRLDGKFIFKSVGDIIEDNTSKVLSKKLPVISLDGQLADQYKQFDESKKNGAPTNFYYIESNEDYMEGILGGGGGGVSYWYDSINDVFVKKEFDVSSSNNKQLTDWSAVCKVDERRSARIYGGRSSSVESELRNTVLDNSDAINKISIHTEKAFGVHIGDMIELIIPVPPDIGSNVPHNVFYSGFYIVCAVSMTVDFNKSAVSTVIKLMRDGYDGKEMKGMVRSKAGKFVGR